MKCVRCKQEIEPQHWHSREGTGRKHMTCPRPNSEAARRRQRQALRWKAQAR
jgi:hypothetical protein